MFETAIKEAIYNALYMEETTTVYFDVTGEHLPLDLLAELIQIMNFTNERE